MGDRFATTDMGRGIRTQTSASVQQAHGCNLYVLNYTAQKTRPLHNKLIDIPRKFGRGAAVPLFVEEAGSPCNTMWPGSRPTSVPSFILIHPTVWPQYTNVTSRTDRQDDGPIG